MKKSELIALSHIIGSGLCHDHYRLTLESCPKQSGWFCSFNHDDTSGIWFSHKDWLDFVFHHTGVSQDAMLDHELWDCLLARYLSQVGALQIAPFGDNPTYAASLLAGIYPVMRHQSCAYTLINLDPSYLQTATESWETFSGHDVSYSLPLVAGWSQPTPSTSPLQAGSALWLQGDIYPEERECLLWWNGPLVVLQSDSDALSSLRVKAVCADMQCHTPPVLAEIGRIDLPLSVISRLADDQIIDVKPLLNDQITLTQSAQRLSHACLLRSSDGLLAKIT